MRILFIGDIYGRPGRHAAALQVPQLRAMHRADVVIACVENAAGGRGLNRRSRDQLRAAGIDVMTTGNHAFDNAEILEFIDQDERIIRAANLDGGKQPGRGYTLVAVDGHGPLGVVQLNGRVFMRNGPNPFEVADELLQTMETEGCTAILVDFHAEATSEKYAMGWHLAGRVAAVVGTHTHVQTADEVVLEGGTAFISDVGMTGPYDSVIGARKEKVLRRFLYNEKFSIQVARHDVRVCGVLVDVDSASGRARSIERIQLRDIAPAPAD